MTATRQRRRHVPIRRCLGCGARRPRGDLVRFVAAPGAGRHVLRRDPEGRAHGRGLYTCPDQACFDRARDRRAFGRAARVGEALDLSGVAPIRAPRGADA